MNDQPHAAKKNRLTQAIKDWLTKDDLRQRLQLPSTRIVDEMMRKRKIPYVKLGHRTVRFHWPSVQSALARFEIKEVR